MEQPSFSFSVNRSQAELGDLKGKYQRCMELASELLALKGKGGGSGAASSSSFGTISTPASSTTARPSSALRSASTSRLAVGGSARVRFGHVMAGVGLDTERGRSK